MLFCDFSNGKHGFRGIGRGKRIISLEFEPIASHGRTRNMNQSSNLDIRWRWNKHAEVRSLSSRTAKRYQVDGTIRHIGQIGKGTSSLYAGY